MARKIKYKSLFKEIPVTPYAVVLWVYITNDWNKTLAEIKQQHPGLKLSWGDDTAAWTEDEFYEDNYLASIFDADSFDEDTVTHEVVHIKNHTMQHAGMKHDFMNDEAEAYMAGWIAGEIYKVWKEYKKK